MINIECLSKNSAFEIIQMSVAHFIYFWTLNETRKMLEKYSLLQWIDGNSTALCKQGDFQWILPQVSYKNYAPYINKFSKS